MEATRPEAERRRCDRISVDYPISYVLEDHGVVFTGMAVNLSEGGLLGYFFDRMSVGTQLNLEMFYIHELQFTALNTQGRIVWKDIMETSEAIEYQYGIEFTKMGREEKARLCNLLTSMKPSRSYST